MTTLGTLRRGSLENTNTPLTSNALVEWMVGPQHAGTNVTESKVLGLPAYYRALAVTAGTLARLPLKVYKNGTRERVAQTTVLDRPNPRQTPVEFRMTQYLAAIAWGNSFARKYKDGAGIVRETWPIHPGRVRVEDVEPSDVNPAGQLFLVRNKGGDESRLTPNEILHIPYMSMDGIEGVRPLKLFAQSLGIAIAGDTSAASLFANGSRMQGVLETDQELSKTAADRLKDRWREKVAGPQNAGQIAVLDRGTHFKPITLPPADAQLLESRKWAVTEIARMVGTPPHLVGDVEKSTSWGTGIEEQVLGWLKFTLATWIELVEQRYARDLLAGPWYCKHSVEGLLRGDSKTRAAFYHNAIVDGWMNRNEVRDLEDLEPVEGLDEYMAPSNMTLISVNGEIVPLSSAGVDNNQQQEDTIQ